jgi:FAD binding domain/Berberine and berberine like
MSGAQPVKPRSTPNWRTLQDTIAGKVLLPGDPEYELARAPANARFDLVRPRAIVQCRTPEDVVETIRFSVAYGVATSTRSGGHCFAGTSTTEGVVLDVTPMNAVSVTADAVTVGAGTRLGPLYETLADHDRTIPAGSCGAVGIAGLTLGGGLGVLGRTYGLTSDHVIGATVVLADGRTVKCDDHHDEDLFWALRGAGAGHFGVVTSFVFRHHPAPMATTFRLLLRAAHAARVIAAWQEWAPTAPDWLAASLVLVATSDFDQPPFVEVFGTMLETGFGTQQTLDAFVSRVGVEPAGASSTPLSWRDTMRYWSDLDRANGPTAAAPAPGPPPSPRVHITKSEFFARPLPPDLITKLVANFLDGRVGGEYRELDFTPWGGAYNRMRPDATAFVHRNELFCLKHAVVTDRGAPHALELSAHRWVTRSWAAVHPWGTGRVFPNFPDSDLSDPAAAYYGTNRERLGAIKRAYDPTSFFRARALDR